MKHTFVLVVLLLAATAFYIVGSAMGALALVAAGVVLELAFWYRLVQSRRDKRRVA
jgi:hypothetical protein